MTNPQDNGRQGGTHTQSSGITATPASERAPRRWTKKEMAEAKPAYRLAPPGLARRAEQVENWPTTFVPPEIAGVPYSAMCKVFYRIGDTAYQASAWIVSGNTGRKGIITAAHVIHDRGVWASDFMVCRQYSQGIWVEEFLSQTGRVPNGWLHGDGVREFWDMGAITPSADLPAMTPAIPAVFGFNPNEAPFNAFYD